MMDCVIAVEPKSCTRKHEDYNNNSNGNNDRLVELLSLFHNTGKGKAKSKTKVNVLREEIKEVLERKVKSDHGKTTDKSQTNNVAQLKADMDITLESQTDDSNTTDDSRDMKAICDGNIRVHISEQMVDLEGQLEYTDGEKAKTKKILQLEQRIKDLEKELKSEQNRSSTILKLAKDSEAKYKELQSRLEEERKTTERCQGIAKTLNFKLHKIRSLLEEAAVSKSKQTPAWQSKLKEVRLQLEEVGLGTCDPVQRFSKIPRKK